MGIWFLIGLIWTTINGAIRKIYTDGDWALPLFCILLGPINILIWAIGILNDFMHKKLENGK